MPIVTHQSFNTEPLWDEFAAVRLVRSDAEMITATEMLLSDPEAREALGCRALSLYEQRFSVARTVEKLLIGDNSDMSRSMAHAESRADARGRAIP